MGRNNNTRKYKVRVSQPVPALRYLTKKSSIRRRSRFMRRLSGWSLAVVLGAGMLTGVVVAQDTGSRSGSTGTQSSGQAGQSTTSPGTTSPTPSTQSPTMDQSAGQSTFPGSTGETQVLIDPGKIYNDRTPTEWVGKSVQLQNV